MNMLSKYGSPEKRGHRNLTAKAPRRQEEPEYSLYFRFPWRLGALAVYVPFLLGRCTGVLAAAALASALICISGSSVTAGDADSRRERAEKAAEVEDYPNIPWSRAVTFDSPREMYAVRTNTSKRAASYIGQLMDFAQKKYRYLFGFDDDIPKLNIYAYRTLNEYQDVIGKIAPHMLESTGMFVSINGEGAIHLPYIAQPGNKTYPTTVLLHEGTHQFVNMTFDFQIPEKLRKYFANNMSRLSSVPLWLNEGLATFMEVSYYDGEDLVVGEINRGRLLQLQYEIGKNKHISLRELFTTKQVDFKASHYAAAWGIVYWFMNDSNSRRRSAKRKLLHNYLLECRKGFMENPEDEFQDKFMKDPNSFAETWDKHVMHEGLKTFVKMTVGTKNTGKKMREWESDWEKWIMKLNPNKPFG